MAPYEDQDDERPPGGPPLPPDDRLWRHPSELGAVAGPTPGSPPQPAEVRRQSATAASISIGRTSTRAALTGACLAGALVTLGVLLLTRPVPDDDLRRTTALGRATTSVPALTSLTAPVAAAANPIHRAQAIPLATPSGSPGRLQVQVTDDLDAAIIVTVEVGGAAHRAGLGEGDRIVAVEGIPVGDAADLSASLSSTRPGDTVAVSVDRDGHEVTVVVPLA